MQDDFDLEEIYSVIPKKVLKSIFENYQLNLMEGIHGLSHWARVIENGFLLSEYNKANRKVIIAFAFFHNSKRSNEEHDPEEGEKGARMIRYYEEEINLSPEEIDLACEACMDFQHIMFNENKDISTCWDSERLDLMRNGIYPNKDKLNTDYAKNTGIITWAMKRGMNHHLSDWVLELIEDLKIS